MSSDSKKSNQGLDEIISPIFGHDYQNRVVVNKVQENKDSVSSSEISYLEKQIEEKVEAQTKIEKAKEYQETYKTDTDVLKQYHKQKETEELKAALPSNYLNFRDTLEKTTDPDLSTISDFDVNMTEYQLNDETKNISETVSTVSEILDELFENNN